ncbi:MAG: protein kinase [Dokdonella sp.]
MTTYHSSDADEQPTVIVPKSKLSGNGTSEAKTSLTDARGRGADAVSAAPDAEPFNGATPQLDHADVPTVTRPQPNKPSPAAATRVLPPAAAAPADPAATCAPITVVSVPQALSPAPAPLIATAISTPAAPVIQMPGPRTGASASPSSARTAGSAAGRSELPNVGEIVKDRFELIDELGRGGMGAVFKARDLRKVEALDPDPYVAIKFISGALIGFERAFVSLQREAKNAQRLNHPNIVKVFDFDRDGALVFLTMEVVQGDALHKRLRDATSAPLTPHARARIAHGMLAGMSYAHERDVSHADLKPSNLMLDANGDLKILDFGIARRAEYDTVFDADDLFALTIDYASPEMLERQRPTPCDDVFALGCIIYALHAGAHPFNHMRADQARNERLRPARPANCTRVQWRALRKSLAFTRAERHQNAAQFLRAYEGRDWRRIGSVVAATLALAAVLLWFVADPVRSSLTVSALAPKQKIALERHLRDGSEYLAGGYAEDAIYAFTEALALDTYSATARDGLHGALRSLRESMSPVRYRGYLTMQQQVANTPAWLRREVDAELARLPTP